MALRSENLLLRRYIEKAMVDLPALPHVVMQVVQATERDTVTTSELESLLGTDAAITTKLLKVVNSAYFGLPRQVTNINQTIAILGYHQVRNLVMSIGVLNVLNSPSPRIAEVQKAFWSNSFAAASAAEMVAKHKRFSRHQSESIFIGGLLHDVGRLFLLSLFNLPYIEVIKESVARKEPLSHVEARVLGVTHAELGGALAEKWNFPESLVNMIRWHESPSQLSPEDPQIFCVHIADWLANTLSSPDFTGTMPVLDAQAGAWLEMDEDGIKDLAEASRNQVKLAGDLLGMM